MQYIDGLVRTHPNGLTVDYEENPEEVKAWTLVNGALRTL